MARPAFGAQYNVRTVMALHRRTFLKNSAVVGLGIAAASQGRILGANDRIRIGGIGVGGRATYLLTLVNQQPETEIVAVCDVYEPRRQAAKAKLAPTAQDYIDYRRLLERKDIDAVVVGTPDHWHVPVTIDAVRAGKDVYVEKPLTKTIDEGPLVEKAVGESDRVVQVGYQQRSWPHFIEAAEIVKTGRLGKITLVLSSWYQNYLGFDPKTASVEADKLDWKRWLGSAPDQPVSAVRYLRWRWFWDFGGGHLTDLFSHLGDVIHWYMEKDTPIAAQTVGDRYVFDYFECPDTITAAWKYPGFGVNYSGTLVCTLTGGNIYFRGSKAMLNVNRDGYSLYPEGVIPAEKTALPDPVASAKSTHDGTIDHMRNFLECVRSRKAPNAPVTSSVAAARAAHLGNLAYRRGSEESPP
jgi:predicted dehydrogenase